METTSILIIIGAVLGFAALIVVSGMKIAKWMSEATRDAEGEFSSPITWEQRTDLTGSTYYMPKSSAKVTQVDNK